MRRFVSLEYKYSIYDLHYFKKYCIRSELNIPQSDATTQP